MNKIQYIRKIVIIVQKFGGTSLGSIELIKNVASIISEEFKKNKKIIVIVSAMSGVTNSLISLCRDISQLTCDDNLIEYDNAISTGEVVSSSLLALALQNIGIKARSMQSWQIPIYTNGNFSSALIKNIELNNIENMMDEGYIPIICGFQGLCEENRRVTTLGRGGSDTSAVAIAAAFKASRCDIYTDVDGLYSADPRLIHNAKIINEISYDQMLELSSMGAKILHPRSVEIAKKYNVPVRIISSFTKKIGTIIADNDSKKLISKSHMINEDKNINSITYSKRLIEINAELNELKLDEFLSIIDSQNINIFLIKKISYNKLSFIITSEFKERINKIFSDLKEKKHYNFTYSNKDEIGLISVIGDSIGRNVNVIKQISSLLDKNNIDFSIIPSGESKISILVKDDIVEKIVRLIHEEIF